jgi:transcriptional regulator with XRE-family HTH domain
METTHVTARGVPLEPEDLLQARRAAGLTREHLAFISGTSVATIQRIERGSLVGRPLRSTMRALTDALNAAYES